MAIWRARQKAGLAGFANGDGAVAGFQRDHGTAEDSARNLSNQVFSGLGGAGGALMRGGAGGAAGAGMSEVFLCKEMEP